MVTEKTAIRSLAVIVSKSFIGTKYAKITSDDAIIPSNRKKKSVFLLFNISPPVVL